MEKRIARKLPNDLYCSVLSNLPCVNLYLSPGNPFCTAARREGNVEPHDVGTGIETLPKKDQQFSDVCLKCPELPFALLATLADDCV